MLAVGTHAFAQRVDKLRLGVVANAMGLGRRDVGRHDGANRRGQRHAAGHGFAPGDGVAGHAIAGRGRVLAALHQFGAAGRGNTRA